MNLFPDRRALAWRTPPTICRNILTLAEQLATRVWSRYLTERSSVHRRPRRGVRLTLADGGPGRTVSVGQRDLCVPARPDLRLLNARYTGAEIAR
jgi:hypothetical protein